MVCTDIMVFLALVLLIVTSLVVYRTVHVIEQYRGYRFSIFTRKRRNRRNTAAFTNANYYNFNWNYDNNKRRYQELYPDLDQNKQIGILTHDSPLQDEGRNSWKVYGTRVYDSIKLGDDRYEFNVFWRKLYIVPTNEIYRGSLFKYGTGPEDNKIPIDAETLDMNIDLAFLKVVPSELRFRHSALHTTPYTFVSTEK
jgi:hypothetical protein